MAPTRLHEAAPVPSDHLHGAAGDGETPRAAPDAEARDDGGRSRVTAAIRLVLAIWLLWDAGGGLANPPAVAAERGLAVEALLPIAALYFTAGLFLVTGFMSRLAGLLLLTVAVWEMSLAGPGIRPALIGLAGGYLVLRGGGTFAMDVYVKHMQDRVRLREARKQAGR